MYGCVVVHDRDGVWPVYIFARRLAKNGRVFVYGPVSLRVDCRNGDIGRLDVGVARNVNQKIRNGRSKHKGTS